MKRADVGIRPQSRVRTWLVNFPRTIPAALFLIVAAITALSVYGIESNAHQKNRAEVRGYAQSIAAAFDRRGNSFSSYLRAGAALFSTVDEVSPQTFSQFVAELRLDQTYRGAEGIGWTTIVARDDVAHYLARVREQQPAYPDIDITASRHPVIAPVMYFSPDSVRNRRALGFDMYSELVRASAMDEAKRTVMPAASGRIVLAHEGEAETSGFAIFMPVYRPTPDTQMQERALVGYLFSSFNAEQFLDAAIDRAARKDLGVSLYDGDSDSANLLVSRPLGKAGADRFEQPVRIANRELLLVVESSAPAALSMLSMVTLLSGLILASMLALVARLLASQAREDQARLAFLEEQQSIRNSLSRELNHRVKNTLANVLSILSLTRRKAGDLDEFADSLDGRIRALSATHDLLTDADWGTTPIDAVISAELMHCLDSDQQRVKIKGPSVELAPNDALSFGLAIHELATNAAKYGALSVAKGTVSVRWHLITDKLAEVEWRESGGPEVTQRRSRGFGTELIEKIVAHELKHPVDFEFKAEGVRCVISVPVRRQGDFQIRKATVNNSCDR